MEDSISQRISKYIESSPYTLTAISRKIGVSHPTLYNQIKGHRAMSLSTVEAFLATFPDVSAEWLLRGDGEIMKAPQAAVTQNQNGGEGNSQLVNYNGKNEAALINIIKSKDAQIARLLGIIENMQNK